jgi:hypothetical protein
MQDDQTTYEYSPSASKNIPFELDENGKIYLRLQINNGPPLRFLLDTGAALLCLIDTKIATELKLETKPGYWVIGTDGSTLSGSVANDITFRISGLSMQHVNAGIVSLAPPDRKSKYKDGVLGFDIFRNFIVDVDYANHTLKLFLPDNYLYKGKGDVIPVTFMSDAAYVKAKVTFPKLAPIEDLFKVDTGDGSVISFHTSFVDKHDLPNKLTIVASGTNAGVGGESQALFAFIDRIDVGTVTLGRTLISLSRAKTGPLSLGNSAGTLGAAFLRNFRVIFDFPRSQMILEKPTAN